MENIIKSTETEKLAIAEKISHMALNYTTDRFEKPNPTLDRLEIARAYFQGAKDAVKNGLTLSTEPSKQPVDPATDRKPVSIRRDSNGEPMQVLVETLDERFAIALHDIDHKMTWEEAMEYDLPTKKQASIICAYLDEINAALVEAGGDKLDKWYWTSSECNAINSWLYSGNYGFLIDIGKNYTRSVRPVLSL